MDALTIRVERRAGSIPSRRQAGAEWVELVKNTIGVSTGVDIAEPDAIERSAGNYAASSTSGPELSQFAARCSLTRMIAISATQRACALRPPAASRGLGTSSWITVERRGGAPAGQAPSVVVVAVRERLDDEAQADA